jgi:hypothetical protein
MQISWILGNGNVLNDEQGFAMNWAGVKSLAVISLSAECCPDCFLDVYLFIIFDIFVFSSILRGKMALNTYTAH